MKKPWMPFYLNDFRLDTLSLSPDEIGVYVILICLAWHRGDGSVSGDMDELKLVLQRCMSNFHGHSFNRIVPKLLHQYFEHRDGRWFQKRVVKELQKADKRSANQSQNANKRWSKHNKNNGLDDAEAMPSQSQSHTQRKKEEGESARKRASRLPENWMPSDDGARFALSHGLSQAEANTEFEKFTNYWTAKGGREAAKLDWEAVWRNWVLTATQRKGKTNGRADKQPLSDLAFDLADEARRREHAAGVGKPPTPVRSS